MRTLGVSITRQTAHKIHMNAGQQMLLFRVTARQDARVVTISTGPTSAHTTEGQQGTCAIYLTLTCS